jgi:hypothetical protein
MVDSVNYGSGSPYAVIEGRLGRLVGLNLNVVAATTIFTVPTGLARCIVTKIVLSNCSGTPTTNAVSFGASATPTDWLGATALAVGFVAGKVVMIFPGANIATGAYSSGTNFVANVTLGGAAITCDLDVWGYYV